MKSAPNEQYIERWMCGRPRDELREHRQHAAAVAHMRAQQQSTPVVLGRLHGEVRLREGNALIKKNDKGFNIESEMLRFGCVSRRHGADRLQANRHSLRRLLTVRRFYLLSFNCSDKSTNVSQNMHRKLSEALEHRTQHECGNIRED